MIGLLRNARLLFSFHDATRSLPGWPTNRMDYTPFDRALYELEHSCSSATAFFTLLLRDSRYKSRPIAQHFANSIHEVLSTIDTIPICQPQVLSWAHNLMKSYHQSTVKQLTNEQNGQNWHFGALHTSAQQLAQFRLEDMIDGMRKIAPELVGLVEHLLRGGKAAPNTGPTGVQSSASPAARGSSNANELAEDLWLEEEDLGMASQNRLTVPNPRKAAARREALIRIKTTVIISIIMHSCNQKCNALESVFGMFLHCANASERVVQALAHMGISIAPATIQNATRSLSRESIETIRSWGKVLLNVFPYDNFDVDFPTATPTIENIKDTLTHLTSACMVSLDHGVKLEDFQCSKALWQSSCLNPHPDPHRISPSPRTFLDLLRLHPEAKHPSGLTRRERFNAWKFKSDLFHYGPAYFRRFVPQLGDPEDIEKIPVNKMKYVPLRSMDIPQNTLAGNMASICEMLNQAGLGDPKTDSTENHDGSGKSVIDIDDYVIPISGDLGAYRMIESLRKARSLEDTPFRRFQFIVFIFGLFHLKMAATDGVWRILIEPKDSRIDLTSLMSILGKHRPKETGKIGSKPGYRRMHEVIQYDGAALRLDAWKVEVSRRNQDWTSLDAFAASKPSLFALDEIANYLACNYVAGESLVMWELRRRPRAERDEQRENTLIMHRIFLLYEELSYAMNYGDIGRLETLFPPWITIFKNTGKANYAKYMMKWLIDVHFTYPEPLRRAIRYNVLVNPSGTPGKFRGLDWVEESMINLYTKHIFGGRGANYTKKRVLEESSLIDIYRQCLTNIEQNMGLTSLIKAHTPPSMDLTMHTLLQYFARNEVQPNNYVPGRRSSYTIPEVMDFVWISPENEEHEDVNEDMHIEAEDLGVD